MHNLNRIGHRLGVLPIVALLIQGGCNPSNTAPEKDRTEAAAPTTKAATADCRKDTDCKGDRICVSGSCRDPKTAQTNTAPPPPAKTAQPVKPAQPAQLPSVRYLTYNNARFGFRVSYPDIYEASNHSDNGDGITFMGQDPNQTLKIWGQNAIAGLNASGFDLYEAAKKQHPSFRQDFANHNFCALAYAVSSGLETHETCFIANEVVRCFAMTYKATARDRHRPMIRRMTRELTNSQYKGTEGER